MTKRSTFLLALGLLFGGTPSTADAATLEPVPEALEEESCDGALLYFVLDGLPTPDSGTVFSYFSGLVPMSDGTPAARVVEERATAILYAVCEDQLESFSVLMGISSFEWILGELWEVRGPEGGRLGTVWYDYMAPFAEGGGVAVQQHYFCVQTPGPPDVVAKVGGWHAGLDRDALYAGGPEIADYLRELHYFGPARRLLEEVNDRYMTLRRCRPVGLQDQGDESTDFLLSYDLYDPSYGPEGFDQ